MAVDGRTGKAAALFTTIGIVIFPFFFFLMLLFAYVCVDGSMGIIKIFVLDSFVSLYIYWHAWP
jgi:hypothetical protein